jgi:hypothetical protein
VVPRRSAEVVLKGLAIEIITVGDGFGGLVLDVGDKAREVRLGVLLTLGAGKRSDEGLSEDLEAVDDAPKRGAWDLTVGQ